MKKELMKKLGSMQQVAYVRPLTYHEGRSRGLNAVEIKNGCLELTALSDKCLDVSALSYKGVNLNFLSKPGLQGLNHYDTNGEEAIRSIMGGFFFTAGLESICAPCTIDGVDYPMHGRAALFGENLVLRRSIRTVYGSKSFTVTDEIENESFRDEPMMILYHINIGYPFLDEGTRLYIPTKKVTPRNSDAEGHEAEYDRMDPPKDLEPEYVFIHDIQADKDGNVTVMAVNEKLELGLKLCYNTRYLPYFMEWKSTASGDYVIGLEPANSSVHGRPWHEERGSVHHLAPFAKEKNELTFTILDGAEEIREAVEAWKRAKG